MKIYTKITFEWKDGEYVKTAEESHDYDGPVSECKGGGGGQENYENLNKLYGIQADQAQVLGDYAKNTVLPGYKKFLDSAQGYGSQANQKLAAEEAGAASDAATSSAAANMADQQASMGVNPGSADYWKQQRGIQIAGGASKAASMTAAERGVEKEGFARTQDAVSLGMGTPTQATQAANSAASAATASGQLQNQQNANTQNGIGAAVRGGFDMYNSFKADGGQVLHLKGGGYVQHLASGGVLGTRGIAMPPPRQTQPLTSPVQEAMSGAAQTAQAAGGGSMAHGIGSGIKGVGDMVGSEQMSAFGSGMENAPGLKETASNLVDKALGNTPPVANTAGLDQLAATTGEEAATVAAESAATDTAAAEAATLAAAETGTEVAATAGAEAAGMSVGAAIPGINVAVGAYGIGKLAGWWADGGNVTPGAEGQTGDVSGPGGPKDDLIPAMLSNGEFVMPVGVVKMLGLKRLEKMRQDGLAFEKQLGMGRQQNGPKRASSQA